MVSMAMSRVLAVLLPAAILLGAALLFMTENEIYEKSFVLLVYGGLLSCAAGAVRYRGLHLKPTGVLMIALMVGLSPAVAAEAILAFATLDPPRVLEGMTTAAILVAMLSCLVLNVKPQLVARAAGD